MLALLRVLLTPRRRCSFTKLPILSYPLCYISLPYESQLDQYHSISQPRIAELAIPRLDHTVNQDVARSNWMITKLSREGRIVEARNMFDEMPDPDVITWTAVMKCQYRSRQSKKSSLLSPFCASSPSFSRCPCIRIGTHHRPYNCY